MGRYKIETDIVGAPNLIIAEADASCDAEAIARNINFNDQYLSKALFSQKLFRKTGDEWVLVWDNIIKKEK